ncbi:DUF1800 domain-containing protein [Nocardioides sp. YIM 152315]|uniref:DUF1800 domain-containing protein n=1 Tax=Nocardioides sp. YIM 152315 TaxID=3031760 RepID=UPI0023DB7851|nr:DUF1800 domain-containing protein [Nocardioides sp. YIM 152315]MDF1602552.1 DUF1800 domain-containing protein [Nocardioides sp. YIM 152315]
MPDLLSPAARHLVGRFSYGVTPALARDVRRAGGAREWFERQLEPGSIRDGAADRVRGWWPSLDRGPTELWKRQDKEIEGGWEVMADYQRWVLLRRMHSRRQLHEVMTELWEHHFNVPVNGDAQFTWRADYGDVIRRHALGRFDELLREVVTHPALLISLDNVSSTKEFPNENLGRELLELHTVGRGAFDERDVKHSARILTGWTVDMWETFRRRYDEEAHARGRVKVMGFRHRNKKADGREVTREYLHYLAHHPATARTVARRLATKFVRDDPPAALVAELARVYLRHDTAIRPVLRALVDSRAFRQSVGAKVRDPGEDLVATYRALGITVRRPPTGEAGERFAANQLLWQVSGMGTMPFSWPRPDGQPIDNASWASPARLIASMEVHQSLAAGWWPTAGAHYRRPEAWLPRRRVRFEDLVDDLSRRILHRRATPRLLKACCQATGCKPRERITADHDLVRWGMYRLLATLLDSPAHLTR